MVKNVFQKCTQKYRFFIKISQDLQDFANYSLTDKIAPKQFRCFNFQRTYLQVVSAASLRRILWGCVKSHLPPAAAEYYFERHIIFEISLREISKMMCLSKDNLARSAIKIFFTQLQYYFPGRALLNSYLSTFHT
jgi:hypothetical protein